MFMCVKVPVVMSVIVLMIVSVIVSVLMIVSVSVIMSVIVSVIVSVPMLMSVIVIVSVIMIVSVIVFMIRHTGTLVQDHIKVAGIDAALACSANPDLISIHMEACQRILQHFSVCAKIQKGRHRHISADTGITL